MKEFISGVVETIMHCSGKQLLRQPGPAQLGFNPRKTRFVDVTIRYVETIPATIPRWKRRAGNKGITEETEWMHHLSSVALRGRPQHWRLEVQMIWAITSPLLQSL